MDLEKNMKFMQIAMKYLPEAKSFFDQKGIEMDMESLQPMVDMLMKVMTDAYELGKEEALNEKSE